MEKYGRKSALKLTEKTQYLIKDSTTDKLILTIYLNLFGRFLKTIRNAHTHCELFDLKKPAWSNLQISNDNKIAYVIQLRFVVNNIFDVKLIEIAGQTDSMRSRINHT